MNRGALLPALLVVLAGCATTAPAERPRKVPDLGPASGGIGWAKADGTLVRSAVWSDVRVAAGDRGGPPARLFTRQPDGKWKGGTKQNETLELVAEEGRLTGPQVNVSLTRAEGGFRISGLWLGDNVELVVDGTGARSQGDDFVRDASGAYVSTDDPELAVFLVGDAARLENPPWPQFALGALSVGWGSRLGIVRILH